MRGSPRMLVAFTLAGAVVVGAIVSLATGFWWALAIAIVLHAAATTLVMVFIGDRLRQQDKPDPVTEAHLEAGEPAR